jgi:hypothetical protein
MFKFFAIGLLLSVALGGAVFLFAPRTYVVTAYLAPGVAAAWLVSYLVPQRLLRAVVPEGGGVAFLALVIPCACSSGLLYSAWFRVT